MNFAAITLCVASQRVFVVVVVVVVVYFVIDSVPPLGVKRPVREAVHSSPSNVDVKNTWSYTSTPPVRLQGLVLS
jgi:hypothetical protein